MYAKKNVSMKVVAILLAVVLLIGGAVGGTVAYLIAAPKAVTNTFVVGAIGELTLKEENGENETGMEDILIIPGVAITKDPVVGFTDNNVAAYVFVKVDADGWTLSGTTYSIGTDDAQMSWTVDPEWNVLDATNYPGVFYKEVAAENTATWHIISEDTITVGTGITEQTIANYANALTFTAYAIQKDGFAGNTGTAWTYAKSTN